MINHEKRFIQVHIPKTAGISVRSLFIPNFDIKLHTDRYMHLKPFHPSYREHWDNYFTFTFVRNPWERMVSCYEFCFKKPTGEIINRIIPQRWPTFESFIKNIGRGQLFESSRFQPQLWWFTNIKTGEWFKYDFIGRVEHLETGILRLVEQFDLNIHQIPQLNTNVTKNYADYYTSADMIEKVRWLYEEDVDYFGYKFEDLKG